MIVVDIETPHARASAALIYVMSFGTIPFRRTWLIKTGEPVWRWEP